VNQGSARCTDSILFAVWVARCRVQKLRTVQLRLASYLSRLRSVAIPCLPGASADTTIDRMVFESTKISLKGSSSFGKNAKPVQSAAIAYVPWSSYGKALPPKFSMRDRVTPPDPSAYQLPTTAAGK